MDLTGRRLIFAQHVKLAPGNLVALNGVLLSMEGAHVVDEATRDRRIQFFRGNVFACIAQLRSALPLGSAIGSSNSRDQDICSGVLKNSKIGNQCLIASLRNEHKWDSGETLSLVLRGATLLLPVSRQPPLDLLSLLLRQIGRRIGPDQRRPLSLPIVNHPALTALAHQKSRRRRRLVGHLA